MLLLTIFSLAVPTRGSGGVVESLSHRTGTLPRMLNSHSHAHHALVRRYQLSLSLFSDLETVMPARTPVESNPDMEVDIGDEVLVKSPPAAKKQNGQRRASGTGKPRKPANLACLNCRPRKIKVRNSTHILKLFHLIAMIVPPSRRCLRTMSTPQPPMQSTRPGRTKAVSVISRHARIVTEDADVADAIRKNT